MEGFPKNTPNKVELIENKIEKPLVKDGVDFVFEQNPELASIGTPEQYTSYLETIFPNTLIKNIVYHETSKKTQPFNGTDFKMSYLGGAYFTFYHQEKVANIPTKFISKYIIPSHSFAAILNVQTPFLITKKVNTREHIQSVSTLRKKRDLSSNDALLGFANTLYDKGELDNFPELPNHITNKNNIEIAVFRPDQIHILGSRADIEKFNNFIVTEGQKI